MSETMVITIALMMLAAGSGIWTAFSVSQFLGFLMPVDLHRWTCARLPLQGTDWGCYVQLHSASRTLPLLLLPHPQASPVPSTSRLTGQVAVWLHIRLAATILLPSDPVTQPRGRATGPRRSFTVIQLGPARNNSYNHNYRPNIVFETRFW